MPNDYIDQVKLTDNTVVDIKDTVSGYSKVFEIHTTPITGTSYYTLDKSWSEILLAIINGDNLIISDTDATYPFTTINNYGIVFGATLAITDSGSTFALTDGVLVINNEGTAMGMAIHMNTPIPTIPSSSAILKGNGSGGVTTATAGTDYQAPLVSGTNIKTVNSNSLVGSGNVSVGTVTSVSTGAGLTGSVTTTGTIKANLNSETSIGTIGTTDNLYAVGVDSNNKLAVLVSGGGSGGTTAIIRRWTTA